MSAYMALPRKEKISPFDTCPLASWQIDSTRQAIHQINDDLELWDGIYKCVTSGGTWRDYSDYPVAWNHAILWGDAPQNGSVPGSRQRRRPPSKASCGSWR
jgi:hypothetical protein